MTGPQTTSRISHSPFMGDVTTADQITRQRASGIIFQWRRTPGASPDSLIDELEVALRYSDDVIQRSFMAEGMFYAGMDDEAAAQLVPLFHQISGLDDKTIDTIGGLLLASTAFDATFVAILKEKLRPHYWRMDTIGRRYIKARECPPNAPARDVQRIEPPSP